LIRLNHLGVLGVLAVHLPISPPRRQERQGRCDKLGRPAEAAHWLRLVDQLRRNAGAVDEPEQTHDPADMVRARYAEAIHFGLDPA
jgi:hypothetical protein